MGDNDEVEVNGKIDLGTRKLVVSHVENATAFYAYLEADKQFMKEIKAECQEKCEGLERLTEKPSLDQIVGAYSSTDKSWYRGRVEQLNQGKQKDLFRVRIIDFGWNSLFNLGDLCDLPQVLADKKIFCEKYKMADLKAKGRADGYTAEDRQRGADWLTRAINKRDLICSCHRQVNYAGGIMADCMVGDLNLNKAALKQGHAILVPSIMVSLHHKKMNSSAHNGKHPHQQKPFQNRMFVNGLGGGSIDLDYTTYNGNSHFGGANQRGSNGVQPRSPKAQDKGKAAAVKKLEKKINDDKKTINELKKATNLDSGIRDIFGLMEEVNQARTNNPMNLETKGNSALQCVGGVNRVIEAVSPLTERLLAGVEAVEAAARMVSDEEKKAVQDPKKVKSIHSKSDLHKCITSYLEMYSEDEVTEQLNCVQVELDTMNPNIPGSWKLVAVKKPETVTRAHLMEVADKVKHWLDESVARETAFTAHSRKEVSGLCQSLDLLSRALEEKEKGTAIPDLDISLDTQLVSVREALQTELAGITVSKLSPGRKGKQKTAESNSDASVVVRSAWKAVTALKNQLEIARKKRDEYGNMLTTMETTMETNMP